MARSTSCWELIQDAKEGRLETLWSEGPHGGTGAHAAPELVAKGQKPQQGSGHFRPPRAAGKKVGSWKTIHLQPQLLPLPGPTPPRQISPVTASLCKGENCPSQSQISRSSLIQQKPPCSRGTAVAKPAPRGSPSHGVTRPLHRWQWELGDLAAAHCSLGIFVGLQRPLFQHGQN